MFTFSDKQKAQIATLVAIKDWQQIRQQAFGIMDRHLLALINSCRCIGEFC